MLGCSGGWTGRWPGTGLVRLGAGLRGSCCLVAVILTLALPGGVEAGGSKLWCSLSAGPYAVGFRLIESHDPERFFAASTASIPGEAALGSQNGGPQRPVQISLFYPAKEEPGGTTMPFREFVYHSAKEANYRSPSYDDKQAAVARVRGSVSGARELKRFDELLAEATASHLDAPPSPGAFPLILLAPGRNGSPLSELIMMEYLASHGFVLAAIPSQGSRSPVVSDDPEDLEHQVRDLEHAMAVLKDFPTADQQQIGAIGFSMGGAAVTLLELRNPQIAALVTLDGSEVGQRRWSDIRSSPAFDTAVMDAPRLRLHAGGPDRAGIPVYREMTHSQRYIVGFPILHHQDFTSWALINDWLWNFDPEAVSAPRGAYEIMSRHILTFFGAYLTSDEQSLKLVAKGPPKRDYPRGFFSARVLKARR